jgi:hypothetical protein
LSNRLFTRRGFCLRHAKNSFVPRSFIHTNIIAIGGYMMKALIKLSAVFYLLMFLNVGCTSTKVHKPYNYGYALSELHRAGNPNSPPTQVVGQGQAAHIQTAQTCSSFPIFSLHGEFVRYHVECR